MRALLAARCRLTASAPRAGQLPNRAQPD